MLDEEWQLDRVVAFLDGLVEDPWHVLLRHLQEGNMELLDSDGMALPQWKALEFVRSQETHGPTLVGVTEVGGYMRILEAVRDAWSWTGLDAARIVATNPFGHAIVEAADGQFWLIEPDRLACERIANTDANLAELRSREAFRYHWDLENLVAYARREVGELGEGRCYCLKIPAVLGGSYERANLASISIEELLSVSGSIAFQIKDLPDGARAELKVVD